MKYALLILLAMLQAGINFILWHKRHSRVSRIFTLFTTVLLLWTITNTLLDYATFATHAFGWQSTRAAVLNITNRLGFMAGAFIIAVLYRLILVFPVQKPKSKLDNYIFWIGAVIGLSTLTSFVSGTYSIKSNGVAAYSYGHGVYVIVLYFVAIAGLVLYSLLQSLRQPLDPQVRRQAKSIVSALILTGVWAIFFILVLPALLNGNTHIIFIGYYSPYIFNTVLLYSIVKQGFLSFRSLVARSVAYALSLGVIVAVFVVTSLLLIRLFSGDQITLGEAIVFAAINLCTALVFQPVKNFFDRITNKVFYRDAYDSQELLDTVNRQLVAYTDLEELLTQVAATLREVMKAEYCYFVIRDHADDTVRIVGKADHPLQSAEARQVRALTAHTRAKVIVTDELDELNAKQNELHGLLSSREVLLLGRLTPSTSHASDELGYLLMGMRRSGNPYTKKDQRTLEIIINELVIAIENSLQFEEIQRFNETLQANIGEATRKLRRTNERLQQLDTTKDEFITMASHQLRTPLTSVKGYLSMVLEGDAGKLNAQQTQLLQQSYASSQRMVFLISDLLNLSRMNTGKFVIEPAPVDLCEVVQAEIDQLAETAKSREVSLQFTAPDTLPQLLLDETKIHQVVMNFIDNAIYYTPPGGHIEVSLKETAGAIEYRVKDTGIGVPRAVQRHLFTKFYRADNARQARPDGTGLGLFMAKKVIAAQGGAIIFESEEGKGSTFGFRFSKAHHLAPSELIAETTKA